MKYILLISLAIILSDSLITKVRIDTVQSNRVLKQSRKLDKQVDRLDLKLDSLLLILTDTSKYENY